MKKSLKALRTILPFVLLLSMLLTACGGAATGGGAVAEGVEQVGKIGGSDRADQEYVWISNWASLPLFVERVYPALDSFAEDFGVVVRKAGPTTFDLAAYIATVEQECARGPAGIIVVGGWDPALSEPVNQCIANKIPVVVTDGDLFTSDRLSYVGTDWYGLGVKMAQFQLAEHERLGKTTCKVATMSPFQSDNMAASRQGAEDTFEGTFCELVAQEDNQSDAQVSAQRSAALMQAYPDLSGLMGFDSEAGPGIVTAVKEAGKAGEIVVTVNEAGAEFLENIKDGTANLITMENYDIMNYLALFMLYTFHNDAIRTAGLDPWESNWMPRSVDSGLVLVTADNVDEVLAYMRAAASE
jgi:ABC-type sugar transport system substrate-binding protein